MLSLSIVPITMQMVSGRVRNVVTHLSLSVGAESKGSELLIA